MEFNLEPYWDDFDATNGAREENYMRILFRPGYAVQARELTQIQSILQNQLKQFGDHIFQDGSPVIGGHLTLDTSVNYIKLNKQQNNQDIDLDEFSSTVVFNSGSPKTRAKVKQIYSTTTDRTLILNYTRGGPFAAGETINTAAGVAATVNSSAGFSGTGSTVTINEGVFYVDGYFVTVQPQTIVLEPYSNTPSYRIGLEIDETIIKESDDAALLDPAQESFNYQAPGAHRYQFALNLAKRSLNSIDDSRFFELLRVENGVITKQVSYPIYSELEKTFARRTFDESGNYAVKKFEVTAAANTSKSAGNTESFILNIAPGKVYVKGFEFETIGTTRISALRARTSKTQKDYPLNALYVNRLQIANVLGSANGIVFGTNYEDIDLHCVSNNQVTLDANTAKYYSTRVGSARVKNIDRTSATNEYYLYLTDVNFTPITSAANGLSSNATSLKLNQYFSSVSDAYKNCTVTFTATGTKHTVTYYDGSTKVVEFTPATTSAPTLGTVFTLSMPVDVIKSIMTVNAASSYTSANLQANIASGSKNSKGNTFIQDTLVDKNIFKVGSDRIGQTVYVKHGSDANVDISRRKLFSGVSFTSNGAATISSGSFDTNEVITYGTNGSTLSSSEILANIIVVAKSNTNAGAIIDMTASPRSVLRTTNKELTFYTENGSGTTFTGDVYITTKVSSAESGFRRTKTKVSSISALGVARSPVIVNDVPTNGTAISGVPGVTIDSANGIVWYQHANTIAKTAGERQSLFVPDVIKINKIYQSGNISHAPNTSNMTDITDRYTFISGQKDNYYDHAAITLKATANPPVGQTAVLFDSFSYSGKGYTSASSYDKTTLYDTGLIPPYASPSGELYELQNCIDLRPVRKSGIEVAPYKGAVVNAAVNVTTSSTLVTANLSLSQNVISPPLTVGSLLRVNGEVRTIQTVINATAVRVSSGFTYSAVNSAIELITQNIQFKEPATGGAITYKPDATIPFELDYDYYLGRIDKLVVTKDKEFKLLTGVPDVAPVAPAKDENSMALYVIKIPPYTPSHRSISLEYIENKRYTMKDIARIDNDVAVLDARITLLEKEKAALNNPQVSPTNPSVTKPVVGLIVDDFENKQIADYTKDFAASIEKGYLGPYQDVSTLGLKPVNLNDSRVFDKFVACSFTEVKALEQRLASTQSVVQPGIVAKFDQGAITLTPESDYFYSLEYAPYISDVGGRTYEITQTEPEQDPALSDTLSNEDLGSYKYSDDLYKNPGVVGDSEAINVRQTVTVPHYSNAPTDLEPKSVAYVPLNFAGVSPETFVQDAWTGAPSKVANESGLSTFPAGYAYNRQIVASPTGETESNLGRSSTEELTPAE